MPRKPAEPKPSVNVIGMVGLDGGQDELSMGIARRLRRGGLSVVTYAPAPVSATLIRLADENGITLCESLHTMELLLPAPRIVWLTLPAGLATRLAIDALQPVLAAGDIIVNTADGHFNDALQYAAILAQQGIHQVDAGIADAPWGESNGYSIMLGGDAAAIKKLSAVLTVLAAADGKGWLHCGDSGAGHFVRMAQGLMERSMMRSFSQGVEFFGNWQGAGQMNPAALEKVWQHGNEVGNELQQLAEAYLAQSVGQAANPTPAPTPATTLARSLSFAASGAKMYMQGLEALLKQRGTGQ